MDNEPLVRTIRSANDASPIPSIFKHNTFKTLLRKLDGCLREDSLNKKYLHEKNLDFIAQNIYEY